MRLQAAMVFLGVVLLSSVVSAQEARNYSPYYNGSFVELSVRGAHVSNEDVDAWGLDVGFRHSFPMLLLDSRLSWRLDQMEPGSRHVLHYGFAAHPLYMLLLGNSWLAYTISSLYLELGTGLEVHNYSETDFGLALTVGTGIDIPLWDADAGQAPWLNVLYRYHLSTLSSVGDDTHLIFIGLAWRRNGLLF